MQGSAEESATAAICGEGYGMNQQYVYTKDALESIYQCVQHISMCASMACVLLIILIVITLIKGK